MAAESQLAALRAVTAACQAAVWSFSDEQAAEGLAFADNLRALFLPPPAAASSAGQQSSTLLQLLPTELLAVVLWHLDTYDLARLTATCRLLWRDALTPPPRPMPLLRPMGLVEIELRRRATACGLRIVPSLPEGGLSWVPYLLKCGLRGALRREASLSAGAELSIFVDDKGCLRTCGSENTLEGGKLMLGHDLGADIDADDDEPRSIDLPTLVPSMQDKRIVSVAASAWHCLALSSEGEVYSWGDVRIYGSLGHADGGARAVPTRIASLSRIERIAAGGNRTSAAVDETGKLFMWGPARGINTPLRSSLLYIRNQAQLTPKWVDALSAVRVVGVALGYDFTLAVTDAGEVFSFGYSNVGALGHGSLETEVLPQRIEALVQTGRRFVAVAAGSSHSLALTEEGELYGWGAGVANGHGRDEPTPQRVAALIGQRVKQVDAGGSASCAVTEKGELYTWGGNEFGQLGHGDDLAQLTPKRVAGLNGVKVATASITYTHTRGR